MARRHKMKSLRGRTAVALLAGWLAVTAFPSAAAADGALWGRTIVVDPGHGGIDGGASAYGVLEKNVVLAIGLDLGAILRGEGAQVAFTRTSDVYVSLAQRVAIANGAGGSAFVAIHGNALNDPSFSGVTTFYGPASGYATGAVRSQSEVAASRTLARDVQAATVAQTGEINQGVQSANDYVLGGTAMPAILIETGFLTNPREAAQLATPSFQSRIASGIAQGVTRFFNAGAPAAHPTPAPQTATGNALSGGYVVQPGDTLSGLAVRLGVSEASLITANALSNADQIIAGQSLIVPSQTHGTTSSAFSAARTATRGASDVAPTTQYTVRFGDTLSGIADRFGVSEGLIIQANQIQDCNTLLAGQQIVVPHPSSSANAGPVSATTNWRYRVRVGDTLSALALRFGVTQQSLALSNGITNTDQLDAGRYLTIPAAS